MNHCADNLTDKTETSSQIVVSRWSLKSQSRRKRSWRRVGLSEGNPLFEQETDMAADSTHSPVVSLIPEIDHMLDDHNQV